MTYDDKLECLNAHDGKCKGEVGWHTVGSQAEAFRRCEFHQDIRIAQYNNPNSMEMYQDSVTPPSWFDPSYAGESWDGE